MIVPYGYINCKCDTDGFCEAPYHYAIRPLVEQLKEVNEGLEKICELLLIICNQDFPEKPKQYVIRK